jgi:ATP-binding cassette subfamily B protein
VILLNTTIRDNICLVKPEATDEEIEAAARAAEIHETITELPDGYQTVVGERGKRLALGQRQRISLARALLADPALLLLDEVTSALDPESEAAINATLRKIARDRTVIVVTHRLPAVMEMDEVIVLDEGQVVEQGHHQTLLERRGLYHKLWQIQTGFIIRANGRSASVSAARLQLIPLFRELDQSTLSMLADQFVSEYYEAGHILFSQRDPGDKFYIIVRGKVSVTSVRSFDQQAFELAVLEDGDYFGEIALEREDGLRTATVRTQLPSLFLTLERKHFESLMANFPALGAVVHQKSLKRSLDLITRLGRRKRRVVFDDLDRED